MAFQSSDLESTWWRLFQKRVVRTKFDFYVFICFNITISFRYGISQYVFIAIIYSTNRLTGYCTKLEGERYHNHYSTKENACKWLITGFVTRLTLRLSLVEQELLALPKHLSSPTDFIGVRVTRSLVLYVCFVDRCLSFCTFSFGHCVVCSSIYGFWLPLWYLQTLLANCLSGVAGRVYWSTLHFSVILDKVRITRDSRISIQQISHERCTPSQEYTYGTI